MNSTVVANNFLEVLNLFPERKLSHDEAMESIDRTAQELIKFPKVDCPVTHRFTPGLYIREIFMPAGAGVVSAIHAKEHPFVISQGVVKVWDRFNNTQLLKAPHTGITKPDTRRVLFILEDCIWTTFHVTDKTNLEEIFDEILIEHEMSFVKELDYTKY